MDDRDKAAWEAIVRILDNMQDKHDTVPDKHDTNQKMKEYIVDKVDQFVSYKSSEILRHYEDVMKCHLEALAKSAHEYAVQVADIAIAKEKKPGEEKS